uniref:Alpha/beta hydrolase fold-3 domain-containing protein n=1 Tax=Arundo donax TaxID=35708 RepID=A0A0A9AWQ1_ARUDO
MLVDRIRDYVARLKAMGKQRVELLEFAGQGHGFAVFKPDGEAAAELVRVVRRFVHGGALAPPSRAHARSGPGRLVRTHPVTLARCLSVSVTLLSLHTSHHCMSAC